MALVTLQEAKDHLLVDTSAGDSWLNMAIESVSGAVQLWLKDEWRLYELQKDSEGNVIFDSSGTPIPLEDSNGPLVKPVVKMATLVEIAVQYRFRDGTDYDRTATGDLYSGRYGYVLSQGPTSLLNALRKSTIA